MKVATYSYLVAHLLCSITINALPLFEYCKELSDNIAHAKLANLPTPINKCDALGRILHHDNIFIKRDDLTGSKDLYGGNKVRKLEFLLGDALQKGAKKIITFGCTGTNHGVATACYAKKLGFECLLMLRDQPNSIVVRQNLLLDHYFDAEMQLFPDNESRNSALTPLLEHHENYFFPTGGSNVLGVLGYVNAAFELKEQIKSGLIAEPDYIYLPIGSCGTTAGLLLGLTLANLHSKVIAIAIAPEINNGDLLATTRSLFFEANKLLHERSAQIPLLAFPHEQLVINKEFCGTQYGLWMDNVIEAAHVLKNTEDITVEGTYSAKAVAAIIKDVTQNVRKDDEVILLWNTYCGLDFSHLVSTVNYKQLIPQVQRYFDEIQ